MSATLVRQARRWKAQESTGDLPDELYEALADGHSSQFEKRIIRNLAKISTIISDEGHIRPYSEFSMDWNYTKSIFGHTHKCELCGHAPIVENCVLTNDDGREILIGNTCVHRYVEIRDENGRVLSQKEKESFLKENMKEAKVEFAKQEFATAYPTAMFDLKRYEALMRSRKKWRGLARTVAKRIVSHGYLGPKTRKAWDDFMLVAEKEQAAYDAYKKQKAIEDRARRDADAERRAAFQQTLNERRNRFNNEGQEWIEQAMEIENEMNSWEKEMVGRTLQKIKTSGVEALSGGFARFREEVLTRGKIARGEVVELPPMVIELKSKQSAGSLTEWESGFVDSIVGRLTTGRSLSDAQMGVVKKILSVR